MALDQHMFEALNPSRFISFSFPNPCKSHSSLRIAVLDSPIEPTGSPSVAAMFVPPGLETDWIFSTESGHYHLLFDSPEISRLILVGDQEPVTGHDSFLVYNRQDSASTWSRLVVSLQPLFLALFPKSCFQHGIPEVPILSFVDNVICSVVLERSIGSSVGEFLVENVEIERESLETREFRRRLRFKRMPNLIQTEIRIIPEANLNLDAIEIQNIEFKLDTRVLVHPYLPPMAASLSLIASSIDEQIQTGHRPKALCVGVGGGALLSFLATHLDFEVVGVEMDMEVLRAAQHYFGLVENNFLHISIGDAIEFLENASKSNKKQKCGSFGVHMSSEYDVIMVDLDSSDARNGMSSPPLEFVGRDVLLSARSVLSEHGILVMNVIPLDKLFFETLVDELRSVFDDLFQINVDNGENFVVIASMCPIKSFPNVTKNEMNSFSSRLRLLLSGAYMDSIKRI
ncbi:eEF1A lysine and N-terminal methyltransferase [Benincasa hispida]|uniref:eEF1A lysine and N-terminal methyltransferase n=1 Tax=Benincasa hispida TaxID=102211 RepID=UPI0019023F2A|nr:eEF1A lysine and N-terminal methyltransferase [Benincasa hispida]